MQPIGLCTVYFLQPSYVYMCTDIFGVSSLNCVCICVVYVHVCMRMCLHSHRCYNVGRVSTLL